MAIYSESTKGNTRSKKKRGGAHHYWNGIFTAINQLFIFYFLAVLCKAHTADPLLTPPDVMCCSNKPRVTEGKIKGRNNQFHMRGEHNEKTRKQIFTRASQY